VAREPNGIRPWRHDEESVTGHQGSQNGDPLGAKTASAVVLRPCSGGAQECSS
jgi:hypothetical protein